MQELVFNIGTHIKSVSWSRLAKEFCQAGLIVLFSLLMFFIVWPYTSGRMDIDFLQTKQHIIDLGIYRWSFYVHIFTSLIVLFCGVALFSDYVLRHYKSIHQIAGRIYVFLLLIFAAPSGLIMAFYANGGWLAQLAFVFLTVIWWGCTWQGFRIVLKGQVVAHRRWMIRSYALTLSAITLRFGQFMLNSWFSFDPQIQYVLLGWGSWNFNLLLAECWIRWKG